jgi:MFS family permease
MPDSGTLHADARGWPHSIEGRGSWIAAAVTLGILSISYGAPLLVVVGLKPMTAALDTDRSVLALAGALVWVGTGTGGILMGWLADRIGVRLTVSIGATMMALGLAVSATGSIWAILVGHGLLIGLVGNGAVFPPLVVYVSRWFDRRRGTALALIASGQYVAGVVWPTVFERTMAAWGWQAVFLGFGALILLAVLPAAWLFLHPAPQAPLPHAISRGVAAPAKRVLGMHPNLVQLLLGVAGFLCCIPMAVPTSHLVAFCSDIGIPAAQGAAMLSVLLGAAFISRQFWGWLADRIGGLRAVFAGSACQAVAIAAFLLTQNEYGLFVISAAFGLGFSGIIPAYVLAIRELYPSSEASWRLPSFLFLGMSGMAFGSWFAGSLYDHYGYYAPAFAAGALFNVLNLLLVGFLVLRQSRGDATVLTTAAA